MPYWAFNPAKIFPADFRPKKKQHQNSTITQNILLYKTAKHCLKTPMEAACKNEHTYVHFFVPASRCKQAAKVLGSFSSIYPGAYVQMTMRKSVEPDGRTKLHSC